MSISPNNATALIVIDVQVGAFDGEKMPPVAEGKKLLSTMATLIRKARTREVPVWFVQDNGRIGGPFEKGSHTWALHPLIAPEVPTHTIEKEGSNAFHQTELEHQLRLQKVDTVIICGVHSEHCIRASCLGAKQCGFKTFLVSDGHGTALKDQAAAHNIVSDQNRDLAQHGVHLVRAVDVFSNA